MVAYGFLRCLMLMGYWLSGGFTGILIAQSVRGLAVAIWEPARNAYLSNAVEDSERARFFGSLNGLKGIVSFPAPIIGAFLYQSFGLRGNVSVSLGLSLLVLLLSVKVRD